MADYEINDRFDSWEDYYLKEKEKPDAMFQQLAKRSLSAFDEVPAIFAGDPDEFVSFVSGATSETFLLAPIGKGGLLVFASASPSRSQEAPPPSSAFWDPDGLSHSRASLEGVTKRLTETRRTRTTEPVDDEEWVPNIDDFLACKDAKDFKNLSPSPGHPAVE